MLSKKDFKELAKKANVDLVEDTEDSNAALADYDNTPLCNDFYEKNYLEQLSERIIPQSNNHSKEVYNSSLFNSDNYNLYHSFNDYKANNFSNYNNNYNVLSNNDKNETFININQILGEAS